MGLTQVSTDGVKNDAITKTKIPANQIEASELADNAVDTNAIADQAVALSKLPHGDGSSDGKFLRANNGADPTFETITGTTINNNESTKFITGSDNANELDGEANLSYNNSLVTFANSSFSINKSASPTIAVKETTGNKEGQFRTNTDGVLLRSLGDYPLILHTNQTERMRIDSSGRVGIGITPVNRILHTSSASSASRIQIDNTTNSNGLQIGADGNGSFQSTLSANDHLIYTNGGLRARWTANGLCFNGDSADANALDDYEEGEYTPTLSNGQTFHSSAYDSLRYTKIGRQVTITGQLVFQAYNSSDFNTTFTIGLPFNNGDGGDRSEYLFHAGVAYFNPSGSSSPSSGYQSIGFYAAANSSHVSIFAIDPNTDTTIGNWVGAGSDVWVNLTYFTDS